jgi:protein-disulfide isomerase
MKPFILTAMLVSGAVGFQFGNIQVVTTAAGEPSAPHEIHAPTKVFKDIDIRNAPARGSSQAAVQLVIFSDFQCPFCSRVVPTLKELEATYGSKLQIIFKNNPLPFHSRAKQAATAALAAHAQGKFWEYHDLLLANQSNLERPALEKHAQTLNLDLVRFKSALDSTQFDAQIAADQAEAKRVGASGTPAFFINGRPLVGAQPIESFVKIIDEELKK